MSEAPPQPEIIEAMSIDEIRGVPMRPHDQVDELKLHIRKFTDQLPGHTQAAMMAKSKAEELCFWLRAGFSKMQRDTVKDA